MADLRTTYMGLEIGNPLVVASCGLTKSADAVRRCADAGAGAVVLKSLFEEQVVGEMKEQKQYATAAWHPEALDYIDRMGIDLGPREYLAVIREAKKAVSIPVIASLNCVSSAVWTSYAKSLAGEGADAIELNLAVMPSDPKRTAGEIERMYFDVLAEVTSKVDVPVAVKIGPYFTSIARLALELSRGGAAALVLFNRFYRIDVDIDRIELSPGIALSEPAEIHLPLRWISLLSGRVECDLAASTGIHDARGVVKMLLAGATVTQLCSTLYRNGLESIGRIRDELSAWMDGHGFESVEAMRGALSSMKSADPELYERIQYIKALVGVE
ncbi:MAG: dihydroorotate dehydrogenase-like protein [Candidatus Krumholzibacteria bacterium]|nr:dihydroorotate dehydrogenase-like protein [Candidatus Krumholzibacteria bacterium]